VKLASVDVAPSISKLVILNLFQDPSGRQNRRSRSSRHPAQPQGKRAGPRFGCAVKWTLKQVQGDAEYENRFMSKALPLKLVGLV